MPEDVGAEIWVAPHSEKTFSRVRIEKSETNEFVIIDLLVDVRKAAAVLVGVHRFRNLRLFHRILDSLLLASEASAIEFFDSVSTFADATAGRTFGR